MQESFYYLHSYQYLGGREASVKQSYFSTVICYAEIKFNEDYLIFISCYKYFFHISLLLFCQTIFIILRLISIQNILLGTVSINWDNGKNTFISIKNTMLS